jgi:hypothetical protein
MKQHAGLGGSFTWEMQQNIKKLTNGAILIISKILKHIMSAAAETEIVAVFINAEEGADLRTTLEELGHKQPPTPMETDNTTATGYNNGTIKQKRTTSMYMRFYCIKDRVKQGQFNVYWSPGFQNLADYFTKHKTPFAIASHKNARYLHPFQRTTDKSGRN